jgi:hypothetical protein
MASAELTSPAAGEGIFRNPWPALGVGFATTLVGFLISRLVPSAGLVLALIGLLATSIALVIRPLSPGVLGLGAVCALLAELSVKDWAPLVLVTSIMTCALAVAALLMLLPQVLRRLAFSGLIVFHFGGIVTAVTTVSPNPWISQQLWARVYRPYLEFMYLNNAYHFYAPEPGPGILAWFYVRYEDGSGHWFKLPTREHHAVALEYQRRLSFCESINQLLQVDSVPVTALQRRAWAFNNLGFLGHPYYPNPATQYHPPNWYSKEMIKTYARYVAGHTPHPTHPELKVTSVKVYRVVHTILDAKMMAEKRDPADKTLYLPYFQGEYDPDGNLRNPDDPMLYWLVPILTREQAKLALAELPGGQQGRPFEVRFDQKNLEADPDDPNIINQLERHARMETKSLLP